MLGHLSRMPVFMEQWDPASLVLMQYIKNTNCTSASSKLRVDYLHTQALLQLGSEAGVAGLKAPKMHFRISMPNNTLITAVMETSPFPSTSSMTSCMTTSEPVDWQAARVGESETSFLKNQTVISCMADPFYPTQREKPSKYVCFFSKY